MALTQAEKDVYGVVRPAIEDQEARTMKKLAGVKARKGTRHWDYGETYDPAKEKKALDPAKVFDLEKEQDIFSAKTLPTVTNVFESFGEAAAESLGVAFNLRDPGLAQDILERDNRLRGTVETTWNKVQEAIIDGEAAGESIDGIAKRIGRVFDQAKGYRSRVIARTETIGAANAGALAGARQSGVVEKKVWLAALDHRTRSTHVTADGQKVDVDGTFLVGAHRMAHPGDPAGGASEVVNCRCTMLFERTPVEDVPADDTGTEAPQGRDAKIAAIKALVKRAQEAKPVKVEGLVDLDASVAHEVAIRDLGRSIRDLAIEEAGDVEIDAAKLNDLRAEKKALMDAQWGLKPGDFATGGARADEVKPGKSYWDTYKAEKLKIEKRWKAIAQEIKRIEMAPREARGRAALKVLNEVREMGIDPKAIVWETGSNKAAKDLVTEMSEWYPKDWWERSNARNPLQAKIVKGRAFYGDQYPEKVQGRTRMVSRLVTGDYAGNGRSTTVHELGHRMESTTDDLTRLEFRFWRRRTEDGTAKGGMRRYRHGRMDEIVNEDDFGDEYMGKSYLARNKAVRERGVYQRDSLDAIERGEAGKVTSWEAFTMGMEEVAFNNYGSWDRDLDLIDFILGSLAGAS